MLPAVAPTVPTPVAADAGTANVALKAPAAVVVIGLGFVVSEVPLNVSETVELAG